MSRAEEHLGLLFVAVALAALSASRPASAQQPGRGSNRTEQERRRILDQLGLEPKTKQPPPAADPPPSPDAPAPVESAPAAPGSASPPAPVSPPPTPFAGRVHGVLLASCRTCHVAGGPAAATRLVLTGDVERDHSAARRLVDPRSPRRSLLLTKATGVAHGGGATLAAGSEPYRRLLQWVSGGAVLTATSTNVAAPSPPAPSSRNPTAKRPAVRAVAPAKPAAAEPLPPPAEAQDTPPATEAPVPETPAAPSPTPVATAPTAVPSTPATAKALHAELARSCRPCHAPGAVAGLTRYLLTGDLRSDLVASRPFAAGRPPATSALVAKAAGTAHGGGTVWPEGSSGRRAALAWIEAGSPVDAEPPPAAASDAAAAVREPVADSSTAAPTAATAPAMAPAPPPAPPIGPGGHAGAHALKLTFLSNTLTLNGRFDLNFERRSFQTNPFDEAGQNAFASYHHFLFLSRTSSADPITLTAEVVTLEFYEIGARLSPRRAPWRLHVRAGKIIVPFGAEPLFHQTYGGHAGFDQRVLPAIWTAEGVAASAGTEWRRLSLSADVFAINGYELHRADGVVNLKSDFAALDEARVAPGARVGAAWGPVWGFYSALVNPLGFGRTMFLQAIDVGLWRWREIPFLGRFALGAGFLRADVFGGGAGQDYYHFASYWLARCYLLDWLALQYRQGVRVFNNRRGVIGDDTRYTSEDGSTHNVTLVARYHGLSLGIAYFINLEKAGEIDDDLLRFTVALDF